MFACDPACGWTLAYSAPNNCLARVRASSSTTSVNSQPPQYRFPGYPSAYLFVNTDPAASSTASLTKFSDAINSSPSCWRRVSLSMAAAICGSTSYKGRDIEEWLMYGSPGKGVPSQRSVFRRRMGHLTDSMRFYASNAVRKKVARCQPSRYLYGASPVV